MDLRYGTGGEESQGDAGTEVGFSLVRQSPFPSRTGSPTSTVDCATGPVQCAWVAVRRKDSYLHAQYLRIRARRGAKKAILAVTASMLTAAYYTIRD